MLDVDETDNLQRRLQDMAGMPTIIAYATSRPLKVLLLLVDSAECSVSGAIAEVPERSREALIEASLTDCKPDLAVVDDHSVSCDS